MNERMNILHLNINNLLMLVLRYLLTCYCTCVRRYKIFIHLL